MDDIDTVQLVYAGANPAIDYGQRFQRGDTVDVPASSADDLVASGVWLRPGDSADDSTETPVQMTEERTADEPDGAR